MTTLPPSKPIRLQWMKDAVAIQSASNPIAVATRLSLMAVAMREEGYSSSEIAESPEFRLFAAKLADMALINFHYPLNDERLLQQHIDNQETANA